MYKIQDRNLYASGDHPPLNSITNDFADSLARNQAKRLIHRPLITKDESNRNFTSWRGRIVCLIKFCHNLLREPFRLFKNILVVTISAQTALLQLVNAPFPGSDREGLPVLIVTPFEATAGILIRPFGFFIDMFQLACGTVIHPALAISLR